MATPAGTESTNTAFNAIVRSALDRTAVRQLLTDRPAVVLERVARGAGATRWFYLASVRDLDTASDRLAPGSRVSFYFDSRIAAYPMNDATVTRILDLITSTGDVVLGTLGADGLEIFVHLVAGTNELGEFTEEVAHGAEVFIGAFPAADNDDHDAVTLTLPDRDGVTRSHPH